MTLDAQVWMLLLSLVTCGLFVALIFQLYDLIARVRSMRLRLRQPLDVRKCGSNSISILT